MTRQRILYVASLILLILLIIWIIWSNSALECTEYSITSEKLPTAFSDFRIVQVSDLHNAQIGRNNSKLLASIEKAAPNIIVITGDLIDSRRTDLNVAVAFVKAAVEIAPCYYAPGNHESRIDAYNNFKQLLIDAGVTVLENEAIPLSYSDATISLIGVDDPSFFTDDFFADEEIIMERTIQAIDFDKDAFSLLLSHRPELFKTYAENGIDLVMCGHAHGGQFRLPGIGGIYAPHQGLFPQYDAGLHTDQNTAMIVSRGIGNSLFPFRINNPPELVIVDLNPS